MNRKLILLNLVLVALLAFAGREIRARWMAAEARQQAVLAKKVAPAPAPAAPSAEAVAPLQAGNYLTVAEQLLFFKDRNPNVVIEQPEEKPVPAFPVAHGVMDFGGGATIILSEKSGGDQKSYRQGEKVGPFLLSKVDSREIVLEWEGKQFTKTIADLKPKEDARAANSNTRDSGSSEERVSAPSPVAAQPTQEQTELQRRAQDNLRPKDGGPGLDVGAAERVCAQGDSAPAGTVQNGYRKVVTPSPFGNRCLWVPMQ